MNAAIIIDHNGPQDSHFCRYDITVTMGVLGYQMNNGHTQKEHEKDIVCFPKNTIPRPFNLRIRTLYRYISYQK